MEKVPNFREANPAEDSLIAEHLYCMWRDNEVSSDAIEYLKSIACTRVILHASPSGKPVYSSLGFSESNEMRLDLG